MTLFKHGLGQLSRTERRILVTLRASMNLSSKETVRIVKEFAQHCVQELGIRNPATITLSTEPFGQMPTAGYYDITNNRIFVCAKNRAIADVLRTLAHELTHCRQMEYGVIFPEDDEGLQPYEDEANVEAAKLVRFYGRKHREIYEDLR